jgi:hypothetical protein
MITIEAMDMQINLTQWFHNVYIEQHILSYKYMQLLFVNQK